MNHGDAEAEKMPLFSQNKFKNAAQMGFNSNVNNGAPASKSSVGAQMPPINKTAQQIQNMQNYMQKAQMNTSFGAQTSEP